MIAPPTNRFGKHWTKRGSLIVLFLLITFGVVSGCNHKKAAITDNPRVAKDARMEDITFFSTALHGDMQYRVFLPSNLPTGQKMTAVYLLHGGGGGFRDWSNNSDVSAMVANGLLLVMPEGKSSYYTNSAEHPEDRYEDYIVHDLIADVEARFPTASGRQNRAIVGVSMGGYGAIKLGLRHPDLYAFAGGLSPAVDVPSRPFSIKRPAQWRFHSSIFGPAGSQTRHDNDPFFLARNADSSKTPYFYIVCGDQEGLLPPVKSFALLLEQRGLPSEFHVVTGGHNWDQWSKSEPDLFRSFLEKTNAKQ